MYMEEEGEKCRACAVLLAEPYIRCAVCGPAHLHMCLHCFARGVQLDKHLNSHKYIVVKDDFELLGDGWTAGEELKLITAISNCGIGNWSEISQHVKSRTRQQCEDHYQRWFISRAQPPLPVLPDPDRDYGTAPIHYRVCEDPPRPSADSPLQAEMSGFMAARSDFALEYDNFAEFDIRDMNFDMVRYEEDEVEKDLKLGVLDIYLNRLRERHRRKKIVRDYGLINLAKTTMTNRRYEKCLGEKFTSLKAMMRLLPPVEFDKYMEALLMEQELRDTTRRLCEYREAGVRHLVAGRVYDKLKARREEHKAKRHLLSDVITHIQDESACQQWLQRQAVLETISKGIPVSMPNAPRRSAPPLDITVLPGYEKLSEQERELCSQARLVPKAYLEFRSLLQAESTKHGSLRLAQARTMIKIDVNKTRKIYDFLASEGYVTKDTGNQ